MSFGNHDNCRRCGTPDGPGHTPTECERTLAQRREAQRVADRAEGARVATVDRDRCGHASPCAWMTSAVAQPRPSDGFAFSAREMEHPDTFVMVTRYVVYGPGAPLRLVRACPACGGNPNEPAPVMR